MKSHISLYQDINIIETLRAIAREQNTSLNEIVRRAIVAYIEQQKGKTQ